MSFDESRPKPLNLTYNFYWSGNFESPENNIRSDWIPIIIIPLLASLILAVSVFLLIIFRQNPTFVITTVTGCLIFIGIYLILVTVDSTKATYE
ncbi:hypothetical protein GWI33_015915 [Rhynchophorus ferrugineus]|uniref:Uncharacterized protein n=1 Tax=Rhynchophorus ferrugineus TaxID=354439 RepID=A0A834I393_RHYFE|nr:hypothetical protein GWI33_015915 [Rhynchophorus ferrugineus]